MCFDPTVIIFLKGNFWLSGRKARLEISCSSDHKCSCNSILSFPSLFRWLRGTFWYPTLRYSRHISGREPWGKMANLGKMRVFFQLFGLTQLWDNILLLYKDLKCFLLSSEDLGMIPPSKYYRNILNILNISVIFLA